MMATLGGVDIGGTKCSVVIGKTQNGNVQIMDKCMYPTPDSPEKAIDSFVENMRLLTIRHRVDKLDAIGISCGSPLDSKRGLILSPPNLPQWDQIDVTGPLRASFQTKVGLQNDANACALAEWTWGAGIGTKNMIFLTFGTGMGAGLILDGKLYVGANDNAGEVGHVRLEDDGPVGYGKSGSFEGFCSGGGIALLAREMAEQRLREGDLPLFCPSLELLPEVTAKKVGEAAQQGDSLALEIYRIVGHKLGKGLAMLVDILNPERIVIGSIYSRQKSLLEPCVMDVLHRETLPFSLSSCEIVPAALGESVGDLASMSVAMNELRTREA